MALRQVDRPAGSIWPSCSGIRDEVTRLYEDILIHVTSFFRDPDVFETLKTHVLPEILKAQVGRGADSRLGGRLLHGRRGLLARDLACSSSWRDSHSAPDPDLRLRRERDGHREGARRRSSPTASLRDVSDERRRRYFTKADARLSHQQDGPRSVRVRPARPRPRPAVLEAGSGELPQRPHLLRPGAAEAGPPDASLRAEPDRLPAARPHREHLRASPSCSRPSTRRTRSSRARRLPARCDSPRGSSRIRRGSVRVAEPDPGRRSAARVDVAKHLDRMLLARYAPPGVLVNEKMEILQFRGADRSVSAAGAGRAAERPHQDGASRAGRGAARGDRAGQEGAWRRSGGTGVEVDQDGLTQDLQPRGASVHRAARTCKEPLFVVLFEEAVPPKREGQASRATAEDAAAEASKETRRLPKARARAGRDQGVSAVADRGARADERRSQLRQRGAGLRERRAPEHERGAGDGEGRAAVDQRGADHRQRRAPQPQSGGHARSTATSSTCWPPSTSRSSFSTASGGSAASRPRRSSILNVVPSDLGRPLDDIKPNIDVARSRPADRRGHRDRWR